jgi:hypothetical protein
MLTIIQQMYNFCTVIDVTTSRTNIQSIYILLRTEHTNADGKRAPRDFADPEDFVFQNTEASTGYSLQEKYFSLQIKALRTV